MEFLEKKKDLYRDASQREPRAKRALMDAFMEICSIAQIIEKEVKDDESFKTVFDKCVSKKSALKKALNKLPETLNNATKETNEVAAARKKGTEKATATAAATAATTAASPTIGGNKSAAGAIPRIADGANEIVGISGKRGRPKTVAAPAAVVAEDPTTPKREGKVKVKEKITPAMREQAWMRFIGNLAVANCPVCDDNKIKMTNFSAGHIVAEACDGPTNKDNLMPICSTCNVRMSTKNLYEYCCKEFGRDPVFPGGGGR